MRRALHWNYKDVFRAARFGFSVKKLWIMFQGLLWGLIVYAVLAYLGFLVSGYTFSEIWHDYRYVPLPWGGELSLWGKVLVGLGIFGFWVFVSIYGTAVAKMTMEQLRGDEFYEISRAIKHGWKAGRSGVFAPLTLVFMVFLILVGGVVLGLLGKIPWFGELVLLVLAVPVLFTVFFMLYLVVSLIVAYYLAPVVPGATRADTFDILFEVFSTLNDENWRFVGYEALLYGVKVLAVGIFAFFVGRTLAVIHAVLAQPWLMGQKFERIADAALSYLPTLSFPTEGVYRAVSWFLGVTRTDLLLYPPVPPKGLAVPEAILGFLFGILVYLLVLLVLAYWGTIHFAGNTLIFTVLVKKKDEIDLTQVDEDFAVAPTHPEAPTVPPEGEAQQGTEGQEEPKSESPETPEQGGA